MTSHPHSSPSVLSPHLLKRSLWTVTLLFFLMYMATGLFFVFFPVFLRGAGFSGGQIGLINMCSSVVSFFSATFWGYMSDRTGKPKLLLAVAAAGTSLVSLLYPTFHEFWHVLILASVFNFFNFAILTLMDSNLLTLLGEDRADYGKYRMGGTLGYIVITLIAGFLLSGRPLEMMFPIYSAINLIFILTALTLPPVAAHVGGINLSPKSVLTLLSRPAWRIFMLTVFILWLAGSGAISFISITLSSMGANSVLIGIVASAAAIFEIPFMLFNRFFMEKLGALRVFHLSLVGYVLRILGYSLMPAPEYGILVNALNGVSYVWFWNSAITYLHKTAPQQLKATSQGLFNSTTALAGMVSAPLAGELFDTIGPQPMYKVLALIAFGALVLFTIFRSRIEGAAANQTILTDGGGT